MQDTVYGLFEGVVGRRPDAPAIVEDGRMLTFGQLSGMVDAIADGFPDGTRAVGVVMDHRAEMIAAILAALKAGAMYVPAEPSFPPGRIRYMMEEAQIDFVLTEERHRAVTEGFPQLFPDGLVSAAEPAGPARAHERDGDDIAYVLYTSGTTGRPKGVCITNRNVCHYVRAFAGEFHPGAGDIMLQNSVCSFDIFVEEVFASLLNGAAIAIPADGDKAGIESLMRFADRHGVTMISGFPYLLAEMNRLPSIPESLRLLISGGDVLRGQYVDNLLGKVEVYNTYGPTETTVCASYHRCGEGDVLEDGTYPIGRPVAGADIKILDGDGDEVPQGEIGEICILGGGVSEGYLGDHEEEGRAFVTLPDGSRMYRSGDLGRILPDGRIAFLHRKDTQVMIVGRRVEVKEVESGLCRCAGVEQAVVKAYADEAGLPYMVGYVVASEPGLKASELRRELSHDLADFMIPEYLVKMRHIPLNANGKPDRDGLPVVMKVG